LNFSRDSDAPSMPSDVAPLPPSSARSHTSASMKGRVITRPGTSKPKREEDHHFSSHPYGQSSPRKHNTQTNPAINGTNNSDRISKGPDDEDWGSGGGSGRGHGKEKMYMESARPASGTGARRASTNQRRVEQELVVKSAMLAYQHRISIPTMASPWTKVPKTKSGKKEESSNNGGSSGGRGGSSKGSVDDMNGVDRLQGSIGGGQHDHGGAAIDGQQQEVGGNPGIFFLSHGSHNH
jgi:hypothetical protein